MASNHPDATSWEDVFSRWNPGMVDQSFAGDHQSMDEYSNVFEPGYPLGSQAVLQVYDVREIDWDTVLTATPGAYHMHFGILPDVASDHGIHHAEHQSVQGDTSRFSSLLPLPASETIARHSSQQSTAPVTARSQPLNERHDPQHEASMASSLRELALPDSGSQHRGIHSTEPEQLNDPRPCEGGLAPRRQVPRFAGDEYTAKWVRGDRLDRAGWCSRCSTWHKLKDSAYWYHMHYSHGISCMTGKPFDLPVAWRSTKGSIGQEAFCGGCNQWVVVGRTGSWRTPYFRHAYKCQAKNNPTLQRAPSRSKSASPRKSAARPSKTC